jgi:hypothetical protein
MLLEVEFLLIRVGFLKFAAAIPEIALFVGFLFKMEDSFGR